MYILKNIIYIIIAIIVTIILFLLYFNSRLGVLSILDFDDSNNSFNKTEFNKDIKNLDSNVKNMEKLHLNRSVLVDDIKLYPNNISKVSLDKDLVQNIDLYFDTNKVEV
jgi:cell division protein FtsB